MNQSGYSVTPLKKKLGIKDGYRIMIINPPKEYSAWTDLANIDIISVKKDGAADLDFIHFFVDDRCTFESTLPSLRDLIKPNGMIWISWPKKASKVKTDMSENAIRNYALEIKLVDVKVCSINAVWSGLKLVIPVKYRGAM